MEKQLEDRTVLVVLRSTVNGGLPSQEIVQGVAKWTSEASDDVLRLWNAANELVASFRDWSFIKFKEAK